MSRPESAVACPACRSPLVLSVAPLRTANDPASTPQLTPRQQDVLALFAAGLRVRQIARRLGISIHTARAHVKTIMRKLDVHSQTELLERLSPPHP
jgi:DNA-binding CsgD family transcriptional regulator